MSASTPRRRIAPVTVLVFLTQGLAVEPVAQGEEPSADLGRASSKAKPGMLKLTCLLAPASSALFMDNFTRSMAPISCACRSGRRECRQQIGALGATLIVLLPLAIGNLISIHRRRHDDRPRVRRRSALLPLFLDIPMLREIGDRGPSTRTDFALDAPTGTPGSSTVPRHPYQADRERERVFRDKSISDRARARTGDEVSQAPFEFPVGTPVAGMLGCPVQK